MVCMGCAHPAKFASTIAEALRLSETQVNAWWFHASPLLWLGFWLGGCLSGHFLMLL